MAPDAAAAPAAAPTVVTTPVVVVGGGLAGLAAALSAAASGAARVLLIDKAGGVGGNSAKASSGVSAVASAVGDQATGAVVEDAVATFRADLLKSGRGRSAAHLADALAAQGGDALKWLETQGVDLSDVVQLGGHSHARTHRPPQKGGKPAPVGWTIISTLKARVAATPAIQIIPHARVVQLLTRAEAAGLTAADGATWPPTSAPPADIDDARVGGGLSARPEAGGV
ncbi:hypothetical protein BU14_0135s0043, partial [Porphyra umbilicalis]